MGPMRHGDPTSDASMSEKGKAKCVLECFVNYIPYCCSASHWATLTRARRDCQNSHSRLDLASSGPGNWRSERQLMMVRRQMYRNSRERARGSANGEVSRADKAAMVDWEDVCDRRRCWSSGSGARALGLSVIPKERFLTAVRSFARTAYVDQRTGAKNTDQGDPVGRSRGPWCSLAVRAYQTARQSFAGQ